MTLADRTVNPEHGFIARPEGNPDDFADIYPDLDDWLHTISKWGVDLDEYCKNLRNEAQKVRNDPSLNNYGKQLQLEQLRKEQEESDFIKDAHKAAEKMEDKEKELSHKLQTAVDNSEIAGPSDPVEKHIDALKLFEMRQVLMQMGKSKRMEEYIKAAENNDSLLLRAIETAHPVMGMVPSEVIQRVKHDRVAKHYPHLSTKVEGMGKIKETHNYNLKMLRQHLRNITAWQEDRAA